MLRDRLFLAVSNTGSSDRFVLVQSGPASELFLSSNLGAALGTGRLPATQLMCKSTAASMVPTGIAVGAVGESQDSSFLLVDFIVNRSRKHLKRRAPSTRYARELFADD